MQFRPPEDHSDFYSIKKNSGNCCKVSKSARRSVFERDGFKCLKCGREDNLTIDHILPRCKGGKNKQSNLQTLCYKCNCNKSDDIIDYRKVLIKIN